MMSLQPVLSLPVDRAVELPIYLQIRQRFKDAIEQGHLYPGERVPSARALAAQLNLARGTIETAYRILVDEGYLLSRGAAGTIVSPSLPSLARRRNAPVERRGSGTATHNHHGRAPRPLQMGLPALDAFPRKVWNRLVGHRLRASPLAGLAYPDPAGYRRLREQIATYLNVSRGVSCVPEQVFITNGYRSSLELILSSLSAPNDAIWFEDPGYIRARAYLQNTSLDMVPVPVDASGLIVAEGERLRPDARFALVTPSHQSPLGVTMSLERRMALLDWSGTSGSWIIEDDYDSEFRYVGRPIPALKSLNDDDRVIYCGTFSKVMFPGLRIAYVVAPLGALSRFDAVCSHLNAGCPYLFQASTADFIAEGHFARHLKKMRQLYAERRSFTQEAFQGILGERIAFDTSPGGLHMLATLAGSENDVELARRAGEAGLAMQPLSSWYLDAEPRQGLLFGFANVISRDDAVRIALTLQEALQ